MFAERKDAVEMALGIALLIWSLKFHWRSMKFPPSLVGEMLLLLVTFSAVLLILLGTW